MVFSKDSLHSKEPLIRINHFKSFESDILFVSVKQYSRTENPLSVTVRFRFIKSDFKHFDK